MSFFGYIHDRWMRLAVCAAVCAQRKTGGHSPTSTPGRQGGAGWWAFWFYFLSVARL